MTDSERWRELFGRFDRLCDQVARLADLTQQRLDLDKAIAQSFGGKPNPT